MVNHFFCGRIHHGLRDERLEQLILLACGTLAPNIADILQRFSHLLLAVGIGFLSSGVFHHLLQSLLLEKTVTLLMNEYTIYQRPNAPIHGGAKLFEVPVRRKGMTRVQCHEYWKNIHGPKVLGCPQMMEPLRRYVQCHSLEEEIPGIKPMRYDGLAELWFDDKKDLLKSFGPEYVEMVNPDEPNFVNLEESTAFVAREFIMYERGVCRRTPRDG